jgi:biopolymer transport protein ExbB
MGNWNIIEAVTAWSQYAVGPTAVAGDAVKVKSIWDFVIKGGPVMMPIGVCSLVALTVIIERLLSLRRGRIIPPDFRPALTGLLDDGGADRREKALDYCRKHGTPIAAIFGAGIKKLGEPVELVERHIQETGQREILKLRKYLRTLSVIAAIAPLLGLLGTILGMIKAFETVAASGEALGRTELLAKGIYEAMITTAGGLIVAIPVVIAYHWFSARVECLVAEIDAMVVEFIEEYARPAPPVVSIVREAAKTTTTPSDNGNESLAAVALAAG